MRDPKRIEPLLLELRDYWLSNPDLRLCQIIGNFLNEEYLFDRVLHNQEPDLSSRGYNTEDDKFLRYLKALDKRSNMGFALGILLFFPLLMMVDWLTEQNHWRNQIVPGLLVLAMIATMFGLGWVS